MYKKVLVPLDGSELAECVLPHVEAIAKGCQVAEVTFIRVVEPVTLPIGDGEYLTPDVMTIWTQVESHERASAEKYLSKLAGQIKYDGVNVKSKVIVGRVAESIANYATDNEIDFIIIATHGRSGINRWVRGSVANRVLHSSQSPVLIIRPSGEAYSA